MAISESARRRVRYLASIGLIAALYYASAKLGLSAGFLNGNVTAVWPPSGFALAVLVLYGSRLWPGWRWVRFS